MFILMDELPFEIKHGTTSVAWVKVPGHDYYLMRWNGEKVIYAHDSDGPPWERAAKSEKIAALRDALDRVLSARLERHGNAPGGYAKYEDAILYCAEVLQDAIDRSAK